MSKKIQKKEYRLIVILRKIWLAFKLIFIISWALLFYIAYSLVTYNEPHEEPPTQIITNEVLEESREVEVTEVVRPYLITEKLPDDYNHRKEMILMAFRYYGVDESLIGDVDRIVSGESKYDPNSKAPTYWSQCEDGRFVEIRDYGNGVWWQDTCEHYGLKTIDSGYSSGLLHIIKPTRQEFGCNAIFNNWLEEVECGAKIINSGNINRWATY